MEWLSFIEDMLMIIFFFCETSWYGSYTQVFIKFDNNLPFPFNYFENVKPQFLHVKKARQIFDLDVLPAGIHEKKKFPSRNGFTKSNGNSISKPTLNKSKYLSFLVVQDVVTIILTKNTKHFRKALKKMVTLKVYFTTISINAKRCII